MFGQFDYYIHPKRNSHFGRKSKRQEWIRTYAGGRQFLFSYQWELWLSCVFCFSVKVWILSSPPSASLTRFSTFYNSNIPVVFTHSLSLSVLHPISRITKSLTRAANASVSAKIPAVFHWAVINPDGLNGCHRLSRTRRCASDKCSVFVAIYDNSMIESLRGDVGEKPD